MARFTAGCRGDYIIVKGREFQHGYQGTKYISELEMSASTVTSFSRRIFGGGTKDAVLSLYFVARSLKCMSWSLARTESCAYKIDDKRTETLYSTKCVLVF